MSDPSFEIDDKTSGRLIWPPARPSLLRTCGTAVRLSWGACSCRWQGF